MKIYSLEKLTEHNYDLKNVMLSLQYKIKLIMLQLNKDEQRTLESIKATPYMARTIAEIKKASLQGRFFCIINGIIQLPK
jgi:hypothetical protein